MRNLSPLLLLAVLACTRGADSASSSQTGFTWAGEPLPERTLVDQCDPTIRVASSRSSYDFGPVDPHAPTFGDRRPDPFHVHLGWPSADTSRSLSVLWRTDVETLATRLELTVEGGEPVVHDGASWLYGGSSPGTGDQRIHEVRLCTGLEPGTAYSYRVGGEGHWSASHSFTTPQPPGTFDSFRIAMMGDSRGSYEQFGQVLAMADAHDPDFFVFAGDMVEVGSRQDEWDDWFNATGDILARKVLVPAHGNHEYLAVHYFAQFGLPNNEEWFSIRYGDLQLVSLNDTVRLFSDSQDQTHFMDAVFRAHDTPWRMATHHRTLWSTSTTHGSNTSTRADWGPTLDAWEVDLVVAAHNHIYERSVPIRGEAEAAPGEGTVYLVSGGAGAPLYTGTEREWFAAAAAKTEHYLIADFGPSGIEVVARDLSDNVLDQFTIPR